MELINRILRVIRTILPPISFWFVSPAFNVIVPDAIAFIVPHRAISKSELSAFIVSVDEVELRSGFDFNSLLDDAVEDDIEDDVESMW